MYCISFLENFAFSAASVPNFLPAFCIDVNAVSANCDVKLSIALACCANTFAPKSKPAPLLTPILSE